MQIKENIDVEHKCSICGCLTSYMGEWGDNEESPCPICEGDEQAHASWERDNIGDN